MTAGPPRCPSRCPSSAARDDRCHSRTIFIGLVALRLGLHVVLDLVGAPITTVAGHWAMAAVMCATTVGLLWFDQRICFRALGLSPARS